MKNQKEITYLSTNTYHTLGVITSKTENIWIAFHGYGELSDKFSNHFRKVDLEKNYIIILQAPSKFYLKTDFKNIGASWLTRENHDIEIKNTLIYVDNVIQLELKNHSIPINTLGFSQGVSIMMRWLSYSKQSPKKVIIWAGILPTELSKNGYDSLYNSKIVTVVGDQDHFVTPEILEDQIVKSKEIFINHSVMIYKGVHRIKRKLLREFIDLE